MKTKLLNIGLVIVIAIVAVINVFNSQKSEVLSDVAMANVEALADDEVNPLCPNGCVENGTGCFCNGWYPSYQEAGKNGNL